MSLSVINTIAINLKWKVKIIKFIQVKESFIAEMYIKMQEDNYRNKIKKTIDAIGEERSGKKH